MKIEGQSQFEADLGHSAKVERHEALNADTVMAAELLKKAGEALKFTKHVDYVGSAAVHVFKSPALGQIFYITQAGTLGLCDEPTAAGAISDLRGSVMKAYGKNPGKQRSGF